MKKEQYKEILQQIKELPTISGNTLAILDLISESNYSVKELANLISLDVSLATKCLRIVNSAHYTLRTQVTSIERAVSYIGKSAVFALVIQNGFNSLFNAPLKGYDEMEGALWEHSLRTAVASRIIANETGNPELADLGYTAGLLHNMGKIILAEYLKDKKIYIREKLKSDPKTDFNIIEEDLSGTNHSEIGGVMADEWGIPEVLKMVILHHHTPSEAPNIYKKICYIVHLGDNFAMVSGSLAGLDAMAFEFDPDSKNYVNIKDSSVDKIMMMMDEEVIEAKKVLAYD